jgi:hypothetical protein
MSCDRAFRTDSGRAHRDRSRSGSGSTPGGMSRGERRSSLAGPSEPRAASESEAVSSRRREGSGAHGTLEGNKAHGRIGRGSDWQRPVGVTDSSAEQGLGGDCSPVGALSAVPGNGSRGEARDLQDAQPGRWRGTPVSRSRGHGFPPCRRYWGFPTRAVPAVTQVSRGRAGGELRGNRLGGRACGIGWLRSRGRLWLRWGRGASAPAASKASGSGSAVFEPGEKDHRHPSGGGGRLERKADSSESEHRGNGRGASARRWRSRYLADRDSSDERWVSLPWRLSGAVSRGATGEWRLSGVVAGIALRAATSGRQRPR